MSEHNDELTVIYDIPQDVNDAWEKWNSDPNSTATVLHGTPEEDVASLIGYAAGHQAASPSPDLTGELVAALRGVVEAVASSSDRVFYESIEAARAVLAKVPAETTNQEG
jgi:hypothetical protein